VSQAANLPTQWSPTENVAWKLPLPGWAGSTPVVWEDRIFLTSEDGRDLVLMCISTQGKQLWKRKLATATGRRARGNEGNEASPSPSTDGRHVYTFIGTGDLACFDFQGSPVWKVNIPERYGAFKMQYGMHTTPLLYGDRLYLQLIHSGGAWVIALDKANGEEVWKVERKSDARAECEQSYASPSLWTNGKDAYLITHGADFAIAHRLDNGAEIWRVGGLNPRDHYNPTLRFVASPVASTSLIVIPSAKNGPVVGLKPDATRLILPGSSHELWRRQHNTPDVPSPLIHNGLVYLCREEGTLLCLDGQTGEQYYAQPLQPQARPRPIYRASPVLADGKLYLTSREGVVSVVRPGKRFEVLATNRMREQISASPAITQGRIYLRTFENLYAIGGGGK
jgi:outer membrane protein assembly factor BamB